MKIINKIKKISLISIMLLTFGNLYAEDINIQQKEVNVQELQKMLTPEMKQKVQIFLKNLPPESKFKMLNLGINAFNTYLRKNAILFEKSDFYIKEVNLENNPAGYFLNFVVFIKNNNAVNPLSNLRLNKMKKDLELFTVSLGVGVEYTFYSHDGRFLFKKIIEYPRN